MPAQFGNIKIGAMQYNGVTIGEAMYNGQIVYQSAPAIEAVVGEWGPEQVGASLTVGAHTIAQNGTYYIRHTVTGGPWGRAGIVTPALPFVIWAQPGDPSVSEFTTALATGHVVEFRALDEMGISTLSGSWSIGPA